MRIDVLYCQESREYRVVWASASVSEHLDRALTDLSQVVSALRQSVERRRVRKIGPMSGWITWVESIPTPLLKPAAEVHALGLLGENYVSSGILGGDVFMFDQNIAKRVIDSYPSHVRSALDNAEITVRTLSHA